MSKQFESVSALESTFLSKFNEGYKTYDKLLENVPFNESTLKTVIESLTNKNVIKFDSISKEYVYETPLNNNEKVILDGNIMLPVTIIRSKDKILVTRGAWYEFPLDFDVRRIIWNVQLPTETSNSTLVNLIKESALKVRKSRIVQIPEYKQLQTLLIPWSDNVIFQINTVGEELTDVNLIFQIKLYPDSKNKEDFTVFRGFQTRVEISTKELIDQLTVDVETRDFSQIKINRIYNFSDFVFSGNEIPYLETSTEIEYVKITGIRNKIELTYFSFDINGKVSKLNTEVYIDATEGLDKLKTLFDSYAVKLLVSNDFLLESQQDDDNA